MGIKLEAYDVKLLVKNLEKHVGRPITEHLAVKLICVILKWIEKSAIISPNKMDDMVLALYPALIKLLSKKLNIQEIKLDFEVLNAYDFKELLAELEIQGLIVAEECAIETIEEVIDWILESAKISENPYDDMVAVIIPLIIKPLSESVDGISDKVESEIVLDDEPLEVQEDLDLEE